MKTRAAKSGVGWRVGRHHEIMAKFAILLLLVMVQMAAVPFLTILVHNSAKHGQRFQLADGHSNLSIVYKQHGFN